MPGRTFNSTSTYRYGFNGKENDNDAKVGYQSYGNREYDELSGRFISVDPITSKYPELTPYQYASNTPIQAIDMDGLEAAVIHYYNVYTTGKTVLTSTTAYDNLGQGQWTGTKDFKQYNLVNSHGDVTKMYTDYNERDKKWEAGTAEVNMAADKVKRVANKVSLAESIKTGWWAFKQISKDQGIKEVRNNVLLGAAACATGGILGTSTSLFTTSTELAGTKAVLSWGGQALFKGYKNVDYLGVAADAFAAPGLNGVTSGLVNWTPFSATEKIHMFYVNKSATESAIDAGTGLFGGLLGDATWKPLKGLLKTSTEKSFLFFSTQSWLNTATQGTNSALTKTVENEKK